MTQNTKQPAIQPITIFDQIVRQQEEIVQLRANNTNLRVENAELESANQQIRNELRYMLDVVLANLEVIDDRHVEYALRLVNQDTKQPASPTSPPAACSASVWIRGEPPLNKIVLIWNGKQIFGPISFHRDGDLALFLDQVSNYHGGYPTHYMIVPKCEDVETPNTQAEP